MELRYYKMPEGSPILALLGQKWIQNYGNDIDYLHFHNYLEIGFCYEGQGFLILGEDKVRFPMSAFQADKNDPRLSQVFVILPLSAKKSNLLKALIC